MNFGIFNFTYFCARAGAENPRDGQVERDLVSSAGGIGPDGTVGINSPPREWIMGKSFDAGGEGSGIEEERVL